MVNFTVHSGVAPEYLSAPSSPLVSEAKGWKTTGVQVLLAGVAAQKGQRKLVAVLCI